MTAIPHRHKLIGGVFVIVTVAWGIDLLTGQPAPSPAQAGLATALTAVPAVPPLVPADLDALIESLRDDRAARAALPFDQVSRDLFTPTPQMEAALDPAGSPDLAGSDAQDQAARERIPFETRHQLQGVLTGPVTLALIDDVLYRRGASIDGYRLVRIHRDSVILQRGRSRVTLRVETLADR